MTVQELENKKLKKGVFHSAMWKSIKKVNGVEYTKESKGSIRIVPYEKIKEVKLKNEGKTIETTKPSKIQWVIKDLLYIDLNTGNYLVRLATTNHKAKCKYFANGVNISKQDYDEVIKPSNSGRPLVFSVKLENLIDIK